MYREVAVDTRRLAEVVVRMCETHEPIGAYASEGCIRYLFAGSDGVLGVLASTRGSPSQSVSATFPLFDWDEREMRDTRGIALDGLPSPRALFIADGMVPPALCAEGKGVTVIVVGPVHAGIIEPGRFTFSSGGETVIQLDAQLSYSRRGVERFLEGRGAVDAAPRVARICAACSAARSWAYARALETLAGMTCDERTEWARVVFAELERIYNHIFDLASSSAGAGYGYGQTQGLALKERVHRLCAAACGHRLLFDAIVPGGVRAGTLADPPALLAAVEELRPHVEAYLDALFANRSVTGRFAGAGRVPREVARAFGATGPARRASGGPLDVRRSLPYGAYLTILPQPVSETAGDVAARCRVKRAEISDSFALIERALAALGRHAPPPARTPGVRAGCLTTLTEGPRGSEAISVECDDAGRLSRIHLRSASYRNWPVVLRAMEANIVPDFPLVNKSFNLCYACADR